MIEDTDDTDGQPTGNATTAQPDSGPDSSSEQPADPPQSETVSTAPPSKAQAEGAVGKSEPAPDPQAGAGETKTTETFGDDVTPTPTVIGDPDGIVTNRLGGTLQREPTAEELPSDAKIAPLAEQVNPNAAAQAVGAAPTPEEIAGVPQPAEGEKNPVSDTSDASQFLAPDSDQHEEADRAVEDAARDADRGPHVSRT